MQGAERVDGGRRHISLELALNKHAIALNEEGRHFADAGAHDQAEAAYRRAIQADPRWSVPYYNLGLLYKYQHRWRESLTANREATARATDDMDAWWNLGIAATAAGDWATARRAWEACSIPMPPGDGPPSCSLGAVPLRLNPDADGEVVWGTREDPARATLRNIPFGSSGFRWGDVVLHDGAPAGTRVSGGREYPVFNVLDCLHPSPFSTYEVQAVVPDPAAYTTLAELAANAGVAAEDWGSSVRFLCKACSEGRIHEDHDQQGAPGTNPLPCAVAALNTDQLATVLSAWKQAVPGVRVTGFTLVTAPDAA